MPLALLAFCAFAERLSGDPLGWLHAQAQWGYSVGHRPWVELMRLFDGIERYGLYGYFFRSRSPLTTSCTGCSRSCSSR